MKSEILIPQPVAPPVAISAMTPARIAEIQAVIEALEGKKYLWTGLSWWPLEPDGRPRPPSPGFEILLADHYGAALRLTGNLN